MSGHVRKLSGHSRATTPHFRFWVPFRGTENAPLRLPPKQCLSTPEIDLVRIMGLGAVSYRTSEAVPLIR